VVISLSLTEVEIFSLKFNADLDETLIGGRSNNPPLERLAADDNGYDTE
jgi:hypothetical protein